MVTSQYKPFVVTVTVDTWIWSELSNETNIKMRRLPGVSADKFREKVARFELKDTQIGTVEEEWCIFKNVLIPEAEALCDCATLGRP
ncbi:unnamed protein product [Caretta caretta]